jgi:hypothetical protein
MMATSFQVTLSANNNGAYANFNAAFFEFGLSSTDRFGSFDMDFLFYELGVLAPTAAGASLNSSAVPEPNCYVLMLVAIFAIRARGFRGTTCGRRSAATKRMANSLPFEAHDS